MVLFFFPRLQIDTPDNLPSCNVIDPANWCRRGPISHGYHAPMATVPRPFLIQHTRQLHRINGSDQAKPLLLPRQLRLLSTAHTVLQSLMAPDIHDRLLDHIRRLVLSLFLPQRASIYL